MFSPAYAIRSVGRSLCERRRTWSIGLAMMPIRSVVRSFDDANVALCRIAQDSECGLVAGAVISSNRLGEAVELDQYGALINPDLMINSAGSTSRPVASLAIISNPG